MPTSKTNIWDRVLDAAPDTLKLLGAGIAATGIGAPAGVLVGGLGAVLGQIIGKPVTPDNMAQAIQDPALEEKLLEVQSNNAAALQQAAIQRDIQNMQEQTKRMGLELADVQGARARDTRFIDTGRTNWRANLMLALAYLSIIAIVGLLLGFKVDGNTAVGGALLALLGGFAGDIRSAFAFEFGTSRSSGAKDATIAQQSVMLGNSTPVIAPSDSQASPQTPGRPV